MCESLCQPHPWWREDWGEAVGLFWEVDCLGSERGEPEALGAELDSTVTGEGEQEGLYPITWGPQHPERASRWPKPHRSQWQSLWSRVFPLPCCSETHHVHQSAVRQRGPRLSVPGGKRLQDQAGSLSCFPLQQVKVAPPWFRVTRRRKRGAECCWLHDLGPAT